MSARRRGALSGAPSADQQRQVEIGGRVFIIDYRYSGRESVLSPGWRWAELTLPARGDQGPCLHCSLLLLGP